MEVKISEIVRKENSRIRLSQSDVSYLMQDIKQHGLLQPIGLWKQGNKFILAYGNRRLKALENLGYETLEIGKHAIIVDKNFDEEDFYTMNLSENIHREDISPIELSRLLNLFRKKGMNTREIASRLSMPHSKVLSLVRMSRSLPESIQKELVFVKNRTSKDDAKGVPITNINKLVQNMRISQKDLGKVFKVMKREQWSVSDISTFKALVEAGYTPAQAAKKVKRYVAFIVKVPLSIKQKSRLHASAKEQKLSQNKFIVYMLQGRIPLDKSLFKHE